MEKLQASTDRTKKDQANGWKTWITETTKKVKFGWVLVLSTLLVSTILIVVLKQSGDLL